MPISPRSAGFFCRATAALMAFALVEAPVVTYAQQAATPQGTPVGGHNLTNAPLLEVINLLAGELKINYVLDASIKGGSVTVNTYGTVRDVDLRPLLDTILRMNNLAMVEAGNVYRIVPIANISHQPIPPISQSDSSKLADDEHFVLNLVFLHYMTSAEMAKILEPFKGDGAQISSYDGANLLIILDNSRNMKRTLDLIAMFDSESFAGQRVRAYEVKNARPTDVAKELDTVFKAYSLSGTKGNSAVQFIPLDLINTVLAVAPNPGVFTDVETWLGKLDIPPKTTAGSVGNHVYKLKYGRAEVLGSVLGSVYGIPISNPFGSGTSGLYGGMPGNSSYPAQGGINGGMGGGFGGGGFGGGGYGGGGMGGGFNNGGVFGNQQNNTGYNQYGQTQQQQPANTLNPFNAGAAAAAAGTTGATPDQTGTYLTASASGAQGAGRPRIVANPFDNTLIIQSTPEQWDQIESLLQTIDVPPRQVLIDAKIYEVSLSGALSAGVQAYLQKRGATNAGGVTQHQLTGSLATVAGNAGTLFSAGTMVGQARELLATLQASELSSKSKVLSAPSIIATDSIPASITVGDSVPTLSSQGVNPGVTSGGNSLFTNTISNVSTGVGLNILARINPSGIVTMVIDQSVTSPTSTTSSTINSPSFSQRNVSTQVTVNDGDTIAIGGIIDETQSVTSSGIPVLDRIPYLGAIFGGKSYTKARTELIIFMTPHVIYDTNHMNDATEELKQKIRALKKDYEKKNP